MQCWLTCKKLISRPTNLQQRSSSRKIFQQGCQKSIRISPLERACSLVSDDVLEKDLAPGCARVDGYGYTTSNASLGGISSLPGRIYTYIYGMLILAPYVAYICPNIRIRLAIYEYTQSPQINVPIYVYALQCTSIRNSSGIDKDAEALLQTGQRTHTLS
jgi:hypothetical protein